MGGGAGKLVVRMNATVIAPQTSPTFRRRGVLVIALTLLAFAGAATAAPTATPTAKPKAPAAKSAPAATGTAESTLLFGDDHVFAVTPPTGWMVDDTSGLGSNIRVVLYPKGSRWKDASTVMYVNPLHAEKNAPVSLVQMVNRDADSFRKAVPGGRVTAAPALTTDRKQTAQVRYFSKPGAEPDEAVAYIEEKGLVMLLVMSSKSAAGFKSALPAFQQLVRSYYFVAGDIRTPTGTR